MDDASDTTDGRTGAWTAQILTLIPSAFPGVLGESLAGRALRDGIWALETIDLREFGRGQHRSVDDTPAGGGPGMVLRADVVGDAIESARASAPADLPVLCPSPRGKPFDQAAAAALSAGAGVTLLCGRFEGIDERALERFGVEEVSLGDFVLTGGEIAAHAIIDAVVRLLPGVLGNDESIREESFSDGLLEHPHYTRPVEWMGLSVPEVLLSGHHGEIAKWRREKSEEITRERRPDLWEAHLARKRSQK